MKKALTIAAIIVVLVVIVLVVALKSIDISKYREIISAQAKKATGRELIVTGDIDLKLSLTPALTVSGVSFANAPWGSNRDMVKMERLEIEVEIIPLFSGNVIVKRLVLIGPEIFLETDAQGRGNWVFDTGKDKSQVQKPAPTPSGDQEVKIPVIKKVRIENARIIYRDGITKKTTEILLEELNGTAADFNSPVDLKLSGNFNGKKFGASATIGPLSKISAPTSPYPIKVAATIGSTELKAEGTIKDPLKGKGFDISFSLKSPSLKNLGQIVNVDLPSASFTVSANLSEADGSISLENLKATLGKNRIEGKIAVKIFSAKKPAVTADIRLLKLYLDELQKFAGDKPKKDSDATGIEKKFADAPFPIAKNFGMVDADIKISNGSISGIGVEADKLSLNLKLKDKVLSVTSMKGVIAGAVLSGNFSANASQPEVEVVAALSLKNLDIANLLEEAKITEMISSPAIDFKGAKLVSSKKIDLKVQVRGKGKTPKALMSSLSGTGSMDNFDLRLGKSKVAGSASLKISGKTPLITARLTALNLDLDEFLKTPVKKVNGSPAKAGKKGTLDDTPFPTKSLGLVNADIKLFGGRVKAGGTEVKNISFSLSLKNKRLRVAPFKASILGGDLSAEISINASRPKVVLGVKADLKKIDLGELFEKANLIGMVPPGLLNLEGKKLTSSGRVDLKAKINGSGKSTNELLKSISGTVSAKNLNIGLGKNGFAGSLSLKFGGRKPFVTANLSYLNLNMDELMKPAEEKSATKPEKPKPKAEKVFSNKPLPLEALDMVDAEIKIANGRIVSNGVEAKNISLNFSLKNKNLRLKPLRAVVSGGSIFSDISLDASRKTPKLSAKINLKKMDLGNLLKMAKLSNDVSGIKTDLDVDVKTSGKSMHELMAGLNGKVNLAMGNGKVKSKYLPMMTLDLLKLFLPNKDKERVNINCFVTRFDIKNGQANENGILFDSEVITITGKGGLNLGSEEIKMQITPKAKEGGLVKFAVPIDIRGTLAKPTYHPRREQIVASIPKNLGSALGMLLGGVLQQGSRSSKKGGVKGSGADACIAALKEMKAKQAKKSRPPATKEEKPKPKKPARTLEQEGAKIIERGLKDLFKGF